MAPAPPPSRTQSRSGRTLFRHHHLLLLTTTVLFLCVDLLPPMASAAHVVDCRRVVFHPYCRGISARRASYTAEQMKGLNSLQESDNPPFLLEDPGLPNGLNSLEQQPLPITFINEAGQPQTLEMPTSISRQLTKGKVDQQQQQQQQQKFETERDDGGRPRESSSSSSSLLSRGQQVRPTTTPTPTPTPTTPPSPPSHSPPPPPSHHHPVRPLYGDAIVRVLLLRQNALLRLPTYRAHERDRERSGSQWDNYQDDYHFDDDD